MQERRQGFLFWIVMVIGLLLGGRYIIQQSPGLPERLCSYALYPILIVQKTVIEPVKQWNSQRRVTRDLAHCIDSLSVERDELLQEVIALKAELNYLDEIKELLAFKERFKNDKAVITQIIAKHFSDDAHYFLIDAGEKQGITVDMIAIYHNCLLGRVQEVYPLYSKVVAISDKSCKVAAYCAQTKTEGIHEGENSLEVTSLKFVSHLKEMVEGDYLLSSGEGLVFPRGFALGSVAAVERNGLFCAVKVKPLVDLCQVRYCCIWQQGISGEDELKVVAGNWTPLPEKNKGQLANSSVSPNA